MIIFLIFAAILHLVIVCHLGWSGLLLLLLSNSLQYFRHEMLHIFASKICKMNDLSYFENLKMVYSKRHSHWFYSLLEIGFNVLRGHVRSPPIFYLPGNWQQDKRYVLGLKYRFIKLLPCFVDALFAATAILMLKNPDQVLVALQIAIDTSSVALPNKGQVAAIAAIILLGNTRLLANLCPVAGLDGHCLIAPVANCIAAESYSPDTTPGPGATIFALTSWSGYWGTFFWSAAQL